MVSVWKEKTGTEKRKIGWREKIEEKKNHSENIVTGGDSEKKDGIGT